MIQAELRMRAVLRSMVVEFTRLVEVPFPPRRKRPPHGAPAPTTQRRVGAMGTKAPRHSLPFPLPFPLAFSRVIT
jgi:hypothetical protein